MNDALKLGTLRLLSHEQQINMPNGHTIVVLWTQNIVPKWSNGQADGLKYKD